MKIGDIVRNVKIKFRCEELASTECRDGTWWNVVVIVLGFVDAQ